MDQLKNIGYEKKKHLTPTFRSILTCIGEFQPGNKTIYVVFDEESEFSGPRTPKLRLDNFFLGKTFPIQIWKTYFFLLINFLIPLFWGPPRGDGPEGTPRKSARLPSTGQLSVARNSRLDVYSRVWPVWESCCRGISTGHWIATGHFFGGSLPVHLPRGGPNKWVDKVYKDFFLDFSVKNRVLKLRFLAFPGGPGGFRELREASRNHLHLS